MVSAEVVSKVQTLIKTKPIFIASKSYCPYCSRAKKLIGSITNDAYILELDSMNDGAAIQDALYELTGQSTVPNIFIGGKHIGGNDKVQALHSRDKLVPEIKASL